METVRYKSSVLTLLKKSCLKKHVKLANRLICNLQEKHKDQTGRHPAHLFSTRSVLFPTKTITTSLPRSVRTSSTHLLVLRNDCRSASEQLAEKFNL